MSLFRAPAFLCALGAVAMAVALQISSGMFDPMALALATATSLLAITAAVFLRGPTEAAIPLFTPATPAVTSRAGSSSARSGAAASFASTEAPVQVILGAGFLHGIWCHVFLVPTFYADPRRMGGFRGLALLSLLVGSAYLCVHLRASLQRLRLLGFLACFVAMGFIIIHLSPRPHMDVWLCQQIGADALKHGYNPYSVSYPDIYAGESLRFYGPGIVRNHRVYMYPYPPLTALLAVPSFVALGDVRYVSLAAMAIAALAIARLGGTNGEVAALFLLFQGRSFFLLEQGWTEPVVLAAFAVSVLILSTGSSEERVGTPKGQGAVPARRLPQWLALGLSMGVLAASKQYSPLLLVPLVFALPFRLRLRTAAVALALLVATAAPFLIWDADGLVRGVVKMQFLQPLRLDSLSLLALWARLYGTPSWGTVPAFVAAAVVLAPALRGTVTLARACTAAAAAWLVLVLLNKQAFCNYDWLGTGLLCVAVAAHANAARKSKEQAA